MDKFVTMEWSTLLPFIGASVLLTLMPGPDIIFVILLSITNGWRHGVVTALGLCTGLIAHTAAATLGVALLFSQSETAFLVLKFSGAAYLIYLGIDALLKRKRDSIQFDNNQGGNNKNLYLRGILMNLLNPKVSLFFLAFLPQFVSPESSTPSHDMMILGILFMAQAIIVFTIVSLLAHKLSEKLRRSQIINRFIPWMKAIVFFIIAVAMMF
jgi:threonine/homoserine/homoserine lactone efflux protein